jgi:hypothetical protein
VKPARQPTLQTLFPNDSEPYRRQDLHRDGIEGVIVAPASWAAAAEIIPSPWPSTVFPGPKAIKKNPAVPTAAMVPAKIAGTKALGSSLPEVRGRLALLSLMAGSTSVGKDRFELRTAEPAGA